MGFFFVAFLSSSDFRNASSKLHPPVAFEMFSAVVVFKKNNFNFAAFSRGFERGALARRAALRLTDNLHEGVAHGGRSRALRRSGARVRASERRRTAERRESNLARICVSE